MLRGYSWQASPARQSAAGRPLQGARPTAQTASPVKMGHECYLRPLLAGRLTRRGLRTQWMASLVKPRRLRAAGSQHMRIVTLHIVHGKRSTCSYRVPAGRSFPFVHGSFATTFVRRYTEFRRVGRLSKCAHLPSECTLDRSRTSLAFLAMRSSYLASLV